MDSRQSHEGVCHCGAIGYEYRTSLAPEQWVIRACQCTFCRAHAMRSTFDPRGSLRFIEHVPDAMNRYTFGLKTAEFLVCRNCGVYIGARMQAASASFGIVNVRVLHALRERLPEAQPMVYEDEDLAERVARRARQWTPVA